MLEQASKNCNLQIISNQHIFLSKAKQISLKLHFWFIKNSLVSVCTKFLDIWSNSSEKINILRNKTINLSRYCFVSTNIKLVVGIQYNDCFVWLHLQWINSWNNFCFNDDKFLEFSNWINFTNGCLLRWTFCK